MIFMGGNNKRTSYYGSSISNIAASIGIQPEIDLCQNMLII